jgi:chromosome segregation ATPase
VLTRAHQAL